MSKHFYVNYNNVMNTDLAMNYFTKSLMFLLIYAKLAVH